MPEHGTRADAGGADVSSRSARGAKADRRLAWWLVWLYPPQFRRDVGLGLVDAIEDRMRARRAAGASAIGARLPAVVDTLANAPREWLESARTSHLAPALDRTPHDRIRSERTMLDKLLQDVRYALRLWRRRPGFALVAILTLALGVGANTAMFSIVNAVLLRPLPYAHADRLVSVWGKTSAYPRGLISYPEYEEIRKQTGTFEAAGLWLGQSVNITGTDEPQRLVGNFVTGSFFDVLGLRAERGRLFTDDESAPGAAKPVVVITHNVWQRRFNGEDRAIGSVMTVNGVPLTVVGVLQPPFDPDTVPSDGFFLSADMFIPVGQFPVPHGLAAAGPVMLGVARLASGTTVSRATADLEVIRRRLVAAGVTTGQASGSSFVAQSGRSLVAEPAQEAVVGTSRPALVLLFAAVGVVLLIACVNVSQLLLARAVDREREIALRAALGASRGTVARQLTVEALLLAAAASGVGLLLGRLALRTLTWLRPPTTVPIPTALPLDWTVLAFTGAVAIAVATFCGLAPALRAAKSDLSRALQAGSTRTSGTGRRTRDLFMVVEMALSVALVAVSALLIQSLLAIQQAPLGFDASNVFTLQFRLPQSKYPKPDDIARFFKRAIENVRAVPGVQSAALVRAVPFSGNGGTIAYAVEGQPASDPASMPQALFHLVTPEYFKTMRIPILEGRDFTDRDDAQTPLVAVINETFATRAFPGQDPIGKRFTTPQTPGPATIIGVVGDAKHYTSTEPARAQLYIAHYQVPLIFSSLVARTSVAPLTVTDAIRRAIWAVDKDQPVWSIYALETAVDRTQGQSRFLAILLAVFAGIALVLAAVGIYGVTSYGVAQRTHEIGIRLALGASAERVLREVIGRALRLTIVAVLIGVAGGVALGRLATAMLYGVKPTDPSALAGAAAVLALVSIAATYLPARRASRVDPVVALAEE